MFLHNKFALTLGNLFRERSVNVFHLHINFLAFTQLSKGFSLELTSDAWNPEGKW